MGEIIGQGRERVRADRCIESRLDAIGAIIEKGEADGRLPPTGSLGNPLFRTWSTGVWDSTRSAQIASKIDREEQDDLSGVYRIVDVINRATDEELAAWTELFAIVGPGRAIELSEVAQLRRALSQARLAHRQIALSGSLLDALARDLGLPVNQEAVAEYARMNVGLCGEMPAHRGERYGAAPYTGRLEPFRKENRLGS